MYKYELHLHTMEGSLCGKSPAARMVQEYVERGYAGMVVTDHFYRGNTAPDRSLPWHEFVEAFATGYYHALEAAKGLDFDVFFGIEEKPVGWSEFIFLGPTPDWYAAHPELRDMDGIEFIRTLREAGAFAIQAHPYRERSYMRSQEILLFPSLADAVEVRNMGNLIDFDRRAYEYAKAQGLPMVGGSDKHIADGQPLSGIELPQRCATLQELICAIREQRHTVIGLTPAAEPPMGLPEFTVSVMP